MYGLCVLFSYRVVSRRSRCYYSSSSKRLLDILANMPKVNSARIVEAQRQRQQITKKSEKYGPSTVYLQVLGSGAMGAPNTLYLFTDQKRYLFNCGECTQRLAHEHKVKLSKLDHIFITSKTWKNIGGLPGLSLTLQDVGVPNITLHGPNGLDELYNATKRFVIMKDMNVTMAKCTPSTDFEDNVMTVRYVLLGPVDSILIPETPKSLKKRVYADSEFKEFINDDTDYYKSEKKTVNVNVSSTKEKSKCNKPQPHPPVTFATESLNKKKANKVLQDLHKQQRQCSVSYICTLKKRLGTLDLAKCVELGVKPGPMLGQLKNGQDVVLPDGTLVRSESVKTPDDPGPVFIVLDVPDISYLKTYEFKAHFQNDVNPPENIPSLIVHFTPPHVFNHPAYVEFMSLFGPCTRHLVLNNKNSCMGSEAVHRTQYKLHLLDPDIFPLLRDKSVPGVWTAQSPVAPASKVTSPVKLRGLEELKNKIAFAQFQNIITLETPCKGDGQLILEDINSDVKLETLAGRTLTMFHLRPKLQLDRSAEPKLHIQEYIQETMDTDGFVNSLQHFRHLVDTMRYGKSDAQDYPKVVFLGTGSCIPSKTRNTSAIVVHVDEESSLLLDCGEGTFGQLVRFYGPKKVNAFLRTLNAIYISHLHADHHIGLIGVLQARRQAFNEISEENPNPVYLLAPGQIVTWLSLYDAQFESIKNDYTLIPNQELLQVSSTLRPTVLFSLGVSDLRTCSVAHCPNAFGVALELYPGCKITYSGDTLPCQELVKIGKDSTLLIHEATMEDELANEARAKMHSTTTQAIEIGRQMNARFTVLTHFSQRYARLPRLNANILNNNQSVGIAFDNMQITLSDLELLPHMYAPLQLMFAEHCVEMEMKAAQRQRRAAAPTPTPAPPPSTPRAAPTPTPVMSSAPSDQSAGPPKRAHAADAHAAKRSRTRDAPGAAPSRTALDALDAPDEPQDKPDGPPSDDRSAELPAKNVTSSLTDNRIRKNSVNCRATISASQANYRDSYSSRLRRELKGGILISGASSKTHHLRSRNFTTASNNPSPPSRSMSEASDISMEQDRRKSTQRRYTRTIVDSRTKLLRSTSPDPREDGNLAKKTPFATRSVTLTRRTIGNDNDNIGYTAYGKPLVTPMNKKLMIRKDVSPQSPTFHRFRARDISPPNQKCNSDSGNSKIPIKASVSGNKLLTSYTNHNSLPDTKIPRSSFNPKTLKTPVLNRNKPNNNIKKYELGYQDKMKDFGKLPSAIVNRNETYSDLKTRTALIREPCIQMNKFNPNTHSSMRSFKPQLEDIKSSYLLLNVNVHDDSDESCSVRNRGSTPAQPSEEQRKKLLTEAKKKFQSKTYWVQSKYDKIEGLNWISWK